MPRHPDPQLEERILQAASRLWARGGEKTLTMRALARSSGTTTPTVYERYRDRGDLLRALRIKTRAELFSAVRRTRTLHHAVQRYVEFALSHSHAYEVLFDGVARPPSLHERWPTFNLLRERVTERVGGLPRENTRLMISIWCLMHGTAMLIIRGGFDKLMQAQTVHACQDAIDAVLDAAARGKMTRSGPKWPDDLVLGEGPQSRVAAGDSGSLPRSTDDRMGQNRVHRRKRMRHGKRKKQSR